tara:strand:+ start:18 stop:506 length:489 start_codon:yes stop_codon:yes gene_type:complete
MGIFDIDYTKPTYKKYKDFDDDYLNVELLDSEDLYKRSGGSEDMDGDTEDPDELEMSNMGADGKEPLEGNWSDWWDRTKENLKDTNFEGVGGGGGEKSLGRSSGSIGASDPTRGSSSWSDVPNPYTAGLPKYSQSSGNYMQLAQQIFGLLSPVRKPSIPSLV